MRDTSWNFLGGALSELVSLSECRNIWSIIGRIRRVRVTEMRGAVGSIVGCLMALTI